MQLPCLGGELADKTDADEHWIKYKKKEVFESW